MRTETTRSIIAALIGISVAIIMLMQSCTIVHKAEKINTLEINNALEAYYETIWNAENNYPGERRDARKQLGVVVHSYKWHCKYH